MKPQEEQELIQLVDWALQRADQLSEDDSMALLEEFGEWIEYEAELVQTVEMTKITNDF